MGYEQLIALRILHETPNIEGAELCQKADCSFGEFLALANDGYIDAGSERIKPKTMLLNWPFVTTPLL